MTHEWKAVNPHFPSLEAEWSTYLILFPRCLAHLWMCPAPCFLSVFLAHYTEDYFCVFITRFQHSSTSPVHFHHFLICWHPTGGAAHCRKQVQRLVLWKVNMSTVSTWYSLNIYIYIYQIVSVIGLLDAKFEVKNISPPISNQINKNYHTSGFTLICISKGGHHFLRPPPAPPPSTIKSSSLRVT